MSVSKLTLIFLQDVVGFLLSPEAERLRPLLVQELVTGLDYYTRDRLQRAYNSLPSLAPRLPFLGPLPLPLPLTSLPVFIPGLGLQAVQQLVQRLAPPLMQTEEVYLQSLLEVAAGLLGTCCAVLCCAVLCCAVLCYVLLCCAVFCCAVLCSRVLCCATFCCAVLHGFVELLLA